jgi:hypothetical protein
VVKKLKRSEIPSEYELKSHHASKISAEFSVWHGEDAVKLALNHDDAQQFPVGSEELTS